LVPVRIVVATPREFVTAVVSESNPSVLLLRLKFTLALGSKAFPASLTVAVIVEVPLTVIVDGAAETATLPPPTPAVIVIAILPVALPAFALTVAMAFENIVAVSVTEAVPPAVTALPADKLAFTWSPGVKEKDTTVPSGTLLPRLSTTRAVMFVVPNGAMDGEVAVSMRAEALPPLPPTITLPRLLESTLEALQAAKAPKNINKITNESLFSFIENLQNTQVVR